MIRSSSSSISTIPSSSHFFSTNRGKKVSSEDYIGPSEDEDEGQFDAMVNPTVLVQELRLSEVI
ncbi:hypothetical protein A2U01_0051537 [Trifolium medium]|uniref:Uncharacterized protein n=1 Tax=Trifolium medium TaxID=97028 RepID=A0A392R173_9FABA|nr:hypothetical protein [Trifolium medium]